MKTKKQIEDEMMRYKRLGDRELEFNYNPDRAAFFYAKARALLWVVSK